ncbi:hypothetical protein BH23GEM9_BH23GEM9_10810 [soil metagenome]
MEKRKLHGAERLRVYGRALEFAEYVDRLLRSQYCDRSLADQLLRAADSIVLNIAEGAAHYQAGKKLNHYRSAHGSAAECRAALTLLHRRHPRIFVEPGLRKTDMISMMLMALIHAQENRRSN